MDLRNISKTLIFIPILLSLVTGVVFSFYQYNNYFIERNYVFKEDVELLEAQIIERLDVYATALKATKGLFQSSDEVSRSEFKSYIDNLEIDSNYPGVQGIGYSKVLKPEEISTFESNIKQEGFENFKVVPAGERPVYTSIQYLEPFDERNQRAFGYDMFSESTRREAMTRARDTGNISMSSKVTLLQEFDQDVQSGFLIYVPYYSLTETPLTSNVDRIKSIEGYIYSPFRMGDFMGSILREENLTLEFQVYDGRNIDKENLMYSTESSREISSGEFNESFLIQKFGNEWTVVIYENNSHIDLTPTNFGIFSTMLISVVMGLFMSFIVYTLSQREAKSKKLVDELTLKFNTNCKIYEGLIDELDMAFIVLKNSNSIEEINNKAKEMLDAQGIENTLSDLFDDDNLKKILKLIEDYSTEKKVKYTEVLVNDRLIKVIVSKYLVAENNSHTLFMIDKTENDRNFKRIEYFEKELKKLNTILIEREARMAELKKEINSAKHD